MSPKSGEGMILPSMLFRKEVIVRIRSTDREEKAESLCVTLNMTTASRSKPIKVKIHRIACLHIHTYGTRIRMTFESRNL